MENQLVLPATIIPTQVKTGMTIRVHQKIKETDKTGKEKERVQVFEGLVLKVGGNGVSKTMTVRKISDRIGVEKIFPLTLPSIVKLELVRMVKTRRQHIGFVRHSKKALREVKNIKLVA
ncbi:50S ribosomal protein L19 [Candidatus Uhrbacteria bacterium]|nr:50S ribosomal protein L19 [Candidatus Uhrbacteria bacterium]